MFFHLLLTEGFFCDIFSDGLNIKNRGFRSKLTGARPITDSPVPNCSIASDRHVRLRKVDSVLAVGIWVGFGPEFGFRKKTE